MSNVHVCRTPAELDALTSGRTVTATIDMTDVQTTIHRDIARQVMREAAHHGRAVQATVHADRFQVHISVLDVDDDELHDRIEADWQAAEAS